jgi:hypothetical protein
LVTSDELVTSSVWPSAGALATMSVPTLVAPPGRLSTTTAWPKASFSFCATTRAALSLAPPGANGTTMRIERCG